MTTQIAITIGIWLLMLLLLAFTKYDFGGIAMLVVALLVITGCVKPNTALAKLALPTVIIIAAMMMCAAGFSKTRAVKSIGNLLFKVSGGSFERCCGMFMVVLFAMGFVLPGAVGRIAIAYPILGPDPPPPPPLGGSFPAATTEAPPRSCSLWAA